MPRKQAILSRISPDGLGYLLDEKSGAVLPFTVDKIPDYRGQPVMQIEAKRGDEVDYETNVVGDVVRVFLRISDHKKRFAW